MPQNGGLTPDRKPSLLQNWEYTEGRQDWDNVNLTVEQMLLMQTKLDNEIIHQIPLVSHYPAMSWEVGP